jgi:hypothetical protein
VPKARSKSTTAVGDGAAIALTQAANSAALILRAQARRSHHAGGKEGYAADSWDGL